MFFDYLTNLRAHGITIDTRQISEAAKKVEAALINSDYADWDEETQSNKLQWSEKQVESLTVIFIDQCVDALLSDIDDLIFDGRTGNSYRFKDAIQQLERCEREGQGN